MKNLIYTFVILFFTTSIMLAQVPIPAPDQDTPILLTGATAHIGDGTVISNAIIGFDKGKLTIVAQAGNTDTDISQYEVIDVAGKHIYPGFILPNTQLGLVEVNSLRATNDMSEEGTINPNVRSLIAYNTDSENIPTMRFNGILLAETTPTGGIISGVSSVMEMEGWNWEDAVHSADIAMHLNWPQKMRRQFDFATFTISQTPNKNYKKEVEGLQKHFDDAVAYGSMEGKTRNLKMEKMQGLFNGSTILMIHASGAKEIVESVKMAQSHGVDKIVIIAGSSALHVSEFLKDNDIAVVVPPVHSLPSRDDEDIDLPYRLPHLLTEAGVTVALSHRGMLANARNLPFYAGTAAAYGMDKEDALKTITSNTAAVLGIDDRVGTLKVGMDATLFVSQGDALDIRTSILTHAFIGGKNVVLDNKQQALYDRYSEKYGHNRN
ncbi:MAG: amidohydrolase family protein [Saprospiraceae bacterium]|nr:amidohydrolase family protein [Saprospiraceae bacterium]